MRTIAALCLALMLMVNPARALDAAEAETVTAILEQLVEASGESLYHGGGDAFYGFDQTGLIDAAGYGLESWITVYDAVVSGYLATIAQTQFDAAFAGPMASLAASDLPADQKAQMQADLEAMIAEARAARAAGQAHLHAVAPFADRLAPLFSGL